MKFTYKRASPGTCVIVHFHSQQRAEKAEKEASITILFKLQWLLSSEQRDR